MASLALAFDILAKDKASRTLDKVGDSADRTGGKLSGLGSTFDRTGNQVNGLGTKLAGLAKSFAIGVAAVAAGGVVIGKSVVSAASDLNESMSKVNVVFAEGAGVVQEWAKTAASSMGLSRQAALEAAGTFGNFLIAMGSPREAAQEMSLAMVQLAADLASFNNANPEDVLLALRAGLAGEAEPLRRFGVSLSAARVEAEALASGLAKPLKNAAKIAEAGIAVEKANAAAAKALKDHGEESLQYRDALTKVTKAEEALSAETKGKVKDLTAAQKAQAAYLIIQKDTALAQGDFARTSDGLANKQRILAAKFTDLKANIGTGLLPVVLKMAEFFEAKILPILNRYVPDALQATGRFFEETGSKVGDFVSEKLSQLRSWWDDHGPAITEALRGFGEDFQKYALEPMSAVAAFVVEELVPKVAQFVTWILENEGVLKAFGVLIGVTLVTHYVRLATEATISAVKQAAAWVMTEAAAIKAAAVLVAQVALMVARWVFLAGRAVFHAAVIAGAWAVTMVAGTAADVKMVSSAAIQGGAWAALAASAETNAARIARAWLTALGPAALVIGAAEAINEATGQKLNPNNLSLWERLDPRKAFEGMDFDIPFFASGGVMPGPIGKHSLAWVAGGETVLPTHRPGVGPMSRSSVTINAPITVSEQRTARDVVYELGVLQLRAGAP